MDELELFAVIVATNDPKERAALLDRECAERPELKERLGMLLDAHLKSHPLLDRPVHLDPQATVDHLPHSPLVGTIIAGRYKLLEEIGDGGMGTVWMAEQKEPVKRLVAVKLIKAGMDSKAVLARFEAERQALALMDHPNIAKIHDAGTDSSGRPYFVMELVKGLPLTEYCDARKLSVNERLELFFQICSAIQHAHQKAVIHRDLKPSNVLVTEHDGKPVPKVIDFGLAKALNASQMLTDQTLHTAYGTVVGTPLYMAPEQVGINALDVDTRSDIYSLGVILYELLTGSTPLEKAKFKEAAWDEVKRLIREVEPPRPSMRVSSAATLPSLAATRQIEPAKLSALLKGEIDWIVMKALEKDRSRRYESANSLAADVGRYLSGETVSACPPTLGYRLKKAYRKNRATVLLGMAFSLLLLTGVAVATVLAVQARRAEALAKAKRIEAEEQTTKAELIADDYLKLSSVYMDAAEAAEIRTNSARLDADLLEYKADSRVGLLRLARPLKNFSGPLEINYQSGTEKHSRSFENHPEFEKLREFQVAAVISAGQQFVPLMPSLSTLIVPYDADRRTSPNGRLHIASDDRGGVELLAIPSLARLGKLQENDERVLQAGFSPDSQTAWTQDVDSIVRFWNTDGTFRAKTPLRPERFVYPAGMTVEQASEVAHLGNDVLVSDGIAVIRSKTPKFGKPGTKPDDWFGFQTRIPPPPTELYSTHTGQLIRRFDRQDWDLSNFRLAANGHWLTYLEERFDKAKGGRDIEQVVISSADGREIARLDHPGTYPFLTAQFSPSGKWVLTIRRDENEPFHPDQIRLWRSSDWKQVDDVAVIDSVRSVSPFASVRFVTDDIMAVNTSGGLEESTVGLFQIGRVGSMKPYSGFGYGGPEWAEAVGEIGGTMIRCGRVLTDAKTFQRLKPPSGRTYAAELAKLAPDGRFFQNLDTVIEKELPESFDGEMSSGVGRWTLKDYRFEIKEGRRFYDGLELHLLPDPKRLTFPPALLELWAQVVVAGELNEAGQFQPWDQPTWDTKQKELAAMKPPYADFPFPGWAAAEPNLWYRIQANRTSNPAEREQLIDEWQRRTGRIHPHSVQDPWRTPGPDKPEEQQ